MIFLTIKTTLSIVIHEEMGSSTHNSQVTEPLTKKLDTIPLGWGCFDNSGSVMWFSWHCSKLQYIATALVTQDWFSCVLLLSTSNNIFLLYPPKNVNLTAHFQKLNFSTENYKFIFVTLLSSWELSISFLFFWWLWIVT